MRLHSAAAELHRERSRRWWRGSAIGLPVRESASRKVARGIEHRGPVATLSPRCQKSTPLLVSYPAAHPREFASPLWKGRMHHPVVAVDAQTSSSPARPGGRHVSSSPIRRAGPGVRRERTREALSSGALRQRPDTTGRHFRHSSGSPDEPAQRVYRALRFFGPARGKYSGSPVSRTGFSYNGGRRMAGNDI
jgi:hypothetical protein